MKSFRFFVFLLICSAASSYSQLTISGKFVGLDAVALDSTRISLKDGTGDTTYCSAAISGNGSFNLSTNFGGGLLLDVSCPGFKPVQAALVAAHPVSVLIDVRLSPLSQPKKEILIAFHHPNSTLARFAGLHSKTNPRIDRFVEEQSKFRKTGADAAEFKIDWALDTRSITRALQRETEPLLRHELIMQYIELNALKSQTASSDSIKKWIVEIPPDSPAWPYHRNLSSLTWMWHPSKRAYMAEIIEKHPSRQLRARLLSEAVRYSIALRDTVQMDRYLTELTSNYTNTQWAAEARSLLEGLAVGDTVPSFNFVNMDDPVAIISNKTMLGKVYLVDFWATWCLGCVQEMPYLDKAFERFKGHGFTIISISFDKTQISVDRFRANKWKMPWLNAIVGSDYHDQQVSVFKIHYLPYPLLVDAKGIIIGVGDDLRGETLQATLERRFGK